MLLLHPPLLKSFQTSVLIPSQNHFTPLHISPKKCSNHLSFQTRPSPISILQKPRKSQCFSSSNPEQAQVTQERKQEDGDDEDFQVIMAIKSNFNDIVIIDTAESRLLLLDQTHNIHSIFNKSTPEKWTDSYWDEFAALPPIIPPGPIAIYGLGGGTAAHLLLDSYPSLELEGWEIDGVLIDMARDYLGLSELENENGQGGVLKVVIGDALEENAAIDGGIKYAGIIVDLFSGGKVLDEMQEEEFWVRLKGRLMPGGRVMVNCGGAENVLADAGSGSGSGGGAGECEWVVNLTLQAMWEVFKGELCWKKLEKHEGMNYMAMTGEMPDLEEWEGAVPEKLKSKVWGWMPFPSVPSK